VRHGNPDTHYPRVRRRTGRRWAPGTGAAAGARDNGGRLVSLIQLTEDGLPSGVEVSVAVDGEYPVRARARVGVEFTAAEPTGSFRPVDLHGLAGRAAVVAAAAYQSASVFSSIDPASTAFWNASSSSGGIV